MPLSILIASVVLGASSTAALAATAPGLGAAGGFAVLSAPPSGGAVTCSGGTISGGDIGSSGSVTGCTGTIVAPVSAQVVTDFNSAYAAYAPISCTQVLTGTLAGAILAPGVYCFDAAATLTGTMTLSGPSTGTWIFKIGTSGTGALTGSSFSVVMAGGGLTCNVDWQVAQGATMTDSTFVGTILAGAAISLTRGTFAGNALTKAGFTMTDTSLAGCPPPPPTADIAISKTVDNTTPSLGSNVTFTVTATNAGPDNATGVQVSDLLPSGLSFVSAAPSAGTYLSGTGIWSIGALANGASATLSIVATATSTATMTNTASKTAEDQADPISTNNSASATVTPLGADIAVTKTVDNPTPRLGSNVTFTVTATNAGPDNATGVQVSDLLPGGLTFVLATPSAGTYDSGTGVWSIGVLANGAGATLSIVATASITAGMTNTASKAAEDQLDAVSANDSASATVTAVAADIALTKTVDNPTPVLGSTVRFTITAANVGPSDATGVQVTDVLPPGLTLVLVTPSTGTYDSGTGIWIIGALANGAGATLEIAATVTSSAAITNTATKTSEVQVDPVSGNNTASATVNAVAADIAITKTVDDPAPSLGTNVTFTISATNRGPSSATGVQVTDVLPPGLTLALATPGAGTYDSATGIWNIGGLADGTTVTLSITATVTVTTAVTNTATKTGAGQVDPVSANNAANVTVTAQTADIAVTQSVDNPTPSAGANAIFTIAAVNYGPSIATGVQLTDVLPAGLSFVSAVASAGTYDAVTGLWSVGSLANLGNATLSITTTVSLTTAVTNTAAKTGEVQQDGVPSNDSASATVTGRADAALPGLPNTSAPDAWFGGAGSSTPQNPADLPPAILAVLAALGVLAIAGSSQRRNRASVGQRRSRSSRPRKPRGPAVVLSAAVLSLAIFWSWFGEPAPGPSPARAPFASATELIGNRVVSVVPPAAPESETFSRVAGAITPSRLRIPTIGVDAWIGAVGLRSDGSMDVPDNLWTASWLGTGPRPGQDGIAVIAGHRGVGTPALFSHLENLRPGDRIYVSDLAGGELVYVVTRVASLDLSPSTQAAVFEPTAGQHLVLITCFGRYIPGARTYDHRLVVFTNLLPPVA